MNLRQFLYFGVSSLAGIPVRREYQRALREDKAPNLKEIQRQMLVQTLEYCHRRVPYYSELMAARGDSFRQDPEAYLANFPILTKATLRQNFERMQATGIRRRGWRSNTSGGSTGEPVVFIQDPGFVARMLGVQLLSFDWVGRTFGKRGVRVWGSERDILQGSMGLKMSLINFLTNDAWINAFRMAPDRIEGFLKQLNDHPPYLILAYAQSLYELAQFAEKEHISLVPQRAIQTSAGTLYPFMREKIEAVFQAPVFDYYGSREVGGIACECEEHNGLHIFPWSNYIEIVDNHGRPLPPGAVGNILVTNLSNRAMPLIRYSIGDVGALSDRTTCACGRCSPLLEKIAGRETDMFQTQDGTLIDGEYFTHTLYFRAWVRKFQVVQKSTTQIVYRIARSDCRETPKEIDDIVEKTKVVMGPDCAVTFDFVDDIPVSASGKYRYTISEVGAQSARG